MKSDDALQFRHAEPIQPTAPGLTCAACKEGIDGSFFQAAGHDVCRSCAQRIEQGQQAPPATSLRRAFLYGSGAAFAGCTIYALVGIVLHAEVGLISILVGYMVAKAVRAGSRGLGGRPQQILAVLLTYFAITISYIPVSIVEAMNTPTQTSQTAAQASQSSATPTAENGNAQGSLGQAILYLLLVVVAAPFLMLGHDASAILSLLIIFFGLSRAWRLTGRTDILITGPYQRSPQAT
jgi:hypothetical protein